MQATFADPGAERAALAGVFKYGKDAFVDIDDLLDPSDFTVQTNQIIFKCAQDFYEDGTDRRFDYPSLISTAKKLKLSEALKGDDEKRHIRAILKYPIELDTVRPEAGKVYKLAIGKELKSRVDRIGEKLCGMTGDESLNEILSYAENPLLDFITAMNGGEDDGPHQIAERGEEWLENILANPSDNIGIPSPFPKYNYLIGGGFRRKSISMMGARPKTGKTVFVDNVCLHVSGELGIPTFNADTEMTEDEHLARIMAHLTGIEIRRVESGKVTKKEASLLREKMRWLKTIPYFYQSVIDKTFEEQIASMRRWCIKHVGYDEEGKTKDALIVYDYLQLTDPGGFHGDFKEYQLLGFQMVALHRLAKRCDVPILSMLQLNRDGIDKETTAVAAGSDRIIWKCANFSILKRKDEDEIGEDGGYDENGIAKEGSLKLITLIARHGEGSQLGDYINIKFAGKTAKMEEGLTRNELQAGKATSREKAFPVILDEEATFEGDHGGMGTPWDSGTDPIQ